MKKRQTVILLTCGLEKRGKVSEHCNTLVQASPLCCTSTVDVTVYMLDGWIRRRVVWYVRRKQVMTWRAKRSGNCSRCGRCCQGCPAHDARGKRCKMYKLRPSICRAFPLTPEDIRKVHTCGYHFQK